jgi:hypothetical protein
MMLGKGAFHLEAAGKRDAEQALEDGTGAPVQFQIDELGVTGAAQP